MAAKLLVTLKRSTVGVNPSARGTVRALGLRRIGFSEHLELDPADSGYGYFNYPAYLAEIRRCRSLFQGRLEITAGVEVTWLPELETESGSTLAAMPASVLTIWASTLRE